MTKNTVTAWKVRINMSILASDLVRGAQYDQICQMKSLGPQTMNSINEPSCVLNITGFMDIRNKSKRVHE